MCRSIKRLRTEDGPATEEEIREAALAYLIEFLGQQPDLPAGGEPGGLEAARAVRGSPPEDGGEFKPLMETIELAAAKAYGTTGPGYLAFIPGGGLFTAALADFLATGINRFVNLWSAGPVVAQIENNVVRWLCDLFGYPAESRGILTSGGSMANFSAIVAARRALLPDAFLDGALYVSDQVHASVNKAAALAGFGPRNIRVVPTSPELRMDVDRLRAMVREDRAAGLQPFLVVASAGTTNTGAVDAIAEVACLAVSEGMFLPYGTGSLVVRQGARLREAHFTGAAYLQDVAGDDEIPNFSEYSPELSRDFRGLRVWFPLKLHGVSAFREALDEKLDLARVLHEGLRGIPGLELPWEPELTVVPFRLVDGDDEANKRLLGRINASDRVFMSSTIVQDRFTIRACILSHRTHRDRIDECVDIIRRAVAGN